jgi:2-methylisocitrate lyase-like PEP mutase family enzyme
MLTQAEKGIAFRALHARNFAFVIPNPWDAGTARLLEHMGFEALATTSAGSAFAAGRADNTLNREEVLAQVASIVAATDVPVSADLENCFGDSPEIAAETIRLAAATGLAGGSIEDMSRGPGRPIYDIAQAAERVRAAAEAAHALPFPFTLTARAENYLAGKPDIKDTIARLQAYQEAGADVLYAPGLATREDIAAVVSSVDRPVNVVMGLVGVQLTVADLTALGVRRVSVGGSLARTALGALLRAAGEIKEHGTFTFVKDAPSSGEINGIFRGR